MWAAYRKSSKIVDLKTAVEALQEDFEMLLWDAKHHAVYDNFFSEDSCEELAKLYSAGVDACRKFEKTFCIRRLIHDLKALRLENHLSEVKKYLPADIKNELLDESDED